MKLTWHSPGQPVRFLDLRIADGMLFATKDGHQWPGEPSAIQINATVANRGADPIDDLGYFPSYENLTPAQRRSYLEWLAGGRRDDDPSRRALGYVFLYFYGLERRICIDADREEALLEELIGLLQHYGPAHRSRSFRGYFLNLLHLGGWKLGHMQYRHYWPRTLDLDEGKTGEEALKLVLANLFELSEPMHWSIAYRLAMTDPNSRRSVVVSRSQEQFWSLFEARYENSYPGGMTLKAAKQPTSFWYQPASSALLHTLQSGKRSPFEFRVPNVFGLHSQFRPLSEIWNSCVDDLSGYSRALSSKKQGDPVGLSRWLALPAELKKRESNPMHSYWEWVTRHASADDGVNFVTVDSLAPWFGFPEKAKLTKTQSSEMGNALMEMGWQIAPRADHLDVGYAWEQEVTVYPVEAQGGLDAHTSGLVRLLYLVMPVASADGTVEPEELDTFHRLIAEQIRSEADWKYLTGVEKALMRDTNVALRALSTVAKRIPSKNRDSVLRLLIHIAAADGEISPEEMKVLGRIARALELPSGLVLDIVKQDVAFAEVVVSAEKASDRKGEPIPQRPASGSPGLVLNMDRIEALTQETRDVISMLSEVMAEEETEVVPAVVASHISRAAPTWLDGLGARYHSVFLEIVEMDSIPLECLEGLAQRHCLMADDIIDSINAWADENLGDFLLERADPVQVYRTLLPVDQNN